MGAGDQLDLATKAEVLLDALTQQVSARKHQLHIEQLYWKSLYTGDQVHAVKRVVQEVPKQTPPSVPSSAFLWHWATTVIACVFGQNIVVRSYAEREVTTDQAITCILEVKVPTPDATGGHDVFILNIVRHKQVNAFVLFVAFLLRAGILIRESHLLQMYWVLGLPTNEYGQRKDRIVRTQAFCRRAGDTTAEPALLFGYHEEIGRWCACRRIHLFCVCLYPDESPTAHTPRHSASARYRYGDGRHHTLDRDLLTRFAEALRLPLDAQQYSH